MFFEVDPHTAYQLGIVGTLHRRTSSYTSSRTGSPGQVFLPWNPSLPHLKDCTVHMASSRTKTSVRTATRSQSAVPLSVKNVPFQIETFPFQI